MLLPDRNHFLVVNHHRMSDGGYDIVYDVDLKRGAAKYLCDETVETVLPTGHGFLGAEYEWVGGYKGAGAGKLAELHLWNLKLHSKTTIGFRRMDCEGACIIPPRNARRIGSERL